MRPSSSSCPSHMHAHADMHHKTPVMAPWAAVQLLHTQTPTQQPCADQLPSLEERIQELCEQIKGQNCHSSHFSTIRLRCFKGARPQTRWRRSLGHRWSHSSPKCLQMLHFHLNSAALRCSAWMGWTGSVWTTTGFPGKRPEMDVGFGLCPDKCYSKLVS